MFKRALVGMAAVAMVSLFAKGALGACDATTTKENVKAADAFCDKQTKGHVCILAKTPPACGEPGPAGAACKRPEVCKSKQCGEDNKCK